MVVIVLTSCLAGGESNGSGLTLFRLPTLSLTTGLPICCIRVTRTLGTRLTLVTLDSNIFHMNWIVVMVERYCREYNDCMKITPQVHLLVMSLTMTSASLFLGCFSLPLTATSSVVNSLSP